MKYEHDGSISRFFGHPVYRTLQLNNFTFNCIHPEPKNLTFKLNPETLIIDGIEEKDFIYYPFKNPTFAVTDIKLDFIEIDEIEIIDELNYVLKADKDIINLFSNLRSLFCIDDKNPWILSYRGSGNTGIRIKYKNKISLSLEVTVYERQEDFQITENENGQSALHSPARNQFSRMQNIYSHDIIKEFNRNVHFKCKYLTGLFFYFMIDREYKDLKEYFTEVIFVLENLEFPISHSDLQVYDEEKHIYFLNFLPDFNGKFWKIKDLMQYERTGNLIPNIDGYCSLHFKTKGNTKGIIHLIKANLNLHFTEDFRSTYILPN